MTFPHAIGLLEVPVETADDDLLPLLRLIDQSDGYTIISHGRMPHTGARLYRIEVDD